MKNSGAWAKSRIVSPAEWNESFRVEIAASYEVDRIAANAELSQFENTIEVAIWRRGPNKRRAGGLVLTFLGRQ